jgi:peptidoglycan hydrolase-like protein with peptidoglycan-binding domain
MPTLEADLNASRGLLGLVEHPNGSNYNFVTDWYANRVGDEGFRHAPWCAMSRSWCYDVGAGGDLTYAYCPFIERDARAGVNGLEWLADDVEVGAWVLFDFAGLGMATHVGQVEAVLDGGRFVTLEGNIGNAYRRQVRDRKYVRGFVRVPHDDAPPPVKDPGAGNTPKQSGRVNLPGCRYGSRGRVVKFVQTLTSAAGGVDGIFGAGTDAAVRHFQTEHRLDVDGQVGPATWAALLQAGLDFDAQAGLDIDGDYGPATTAAVLEFQRAHGLTVDGVAGYDTFGALTGQ